MSLAGFRLDASAQDWLDKHPGPWSLVQSAELDALRALLLDIYKALEEDPDGYENVVYLHKDGLYDRLKAAASGKEIT